MLIRMRSFAVVLLGLLVVCGLQACNEQTSPTDQMALIAQEFSTTPLFLHYEMTVSGPLAREKKTASQNNANPVKQNVTYVLGPTLFQVDDGDEIKIYDFKRKKVLSLRKNNKTYEEDSLYAIPAFRELEMQNRQVLNQVLSKAKATSNTFSSFDSACELGIKVPGLSEDGDISVKEEGQKLHFEHQGKPVAEVEFSDRLPPQNELMTEKVIVYNTNLHPFIRDQILARKKMIKRLSYSYNSGGRQNSIDMVLLKQSNGRQGVMDLTGYKREFAQSSPLYAIQRKVFSSPDLRLLNSQEACGMASNFARQQKMVDAFLALIEFSLETGSQGDQETQAIMSSTLSDPTVQLISQNLEPQNEKSAQESLKLLSSLKDQRFEKDYVVDVFKGNIAASLGRDGTKTLISALEKNPKLTGVYKDLGDMFYFRYETPTAWDCWEIAKTIKPDHPMLQPIKEIEQQLEKTHPEYFRI